MKSQAERRRVRGAIAMAGCGIILTLAGCSSSGGAPPPMTKSSAPSAIAEASDGPARVGAPYSIAGRTYTPVDQADYDEVGYASWYGAELGGRPTASGEPFAPTAISAAHRTLPLPSYVEVTRLDTGRTILVRINDRGPADPNRTIDLSTGAAEQLGITDIGMVPVRIRRTNPVESEKSALRRGEAVPVRLDTPDSLLEILRERAALLPVPTGAQAMARTTPSSAPATVNSAAAPTVAVPTTAAASTAVPPGSGGYVVQVAAFSSRARADALARRLDARVSPSGSIFRVRLGPFATVEEARAAVARARGLGQPGAVIQRER